MFRLYLLLPSGGVCSGTWRFTTFRSSGEITGTATRKGLEYFKKLVFNYNFQVTDLFPFCKPTNVFYVYRYLNVCVIPSVFLYESNQIQHVKLLLVHVKATLTAAVKSCQL